MHTTFVILHYLTEDDTIECIDSIQKNIISKDYNIVVVDNASPNGTGEKLFSIFENDPRVEVILSKENLGFAKGNNLGFQKAKYDYHANFIILLNNDTYIEQTDFLDVMIKKYQSEAFAVLGPDIISTIDGAHQNPEKISHQTKSKVILKIINLTVLFIFDYFNLSKISNKLKKISNQLKDKTELGESQLNEKKLAIGEDLVDVKLHGSCLIFSKKYIENFNGLFDKTFMYGEEEILYYICQRKNLKMLYSPAITIFHKEESSTNTYFSNDSRKTIVFRYKNYVKSRWHLLVLMIKKNI